MCIGTGYYSNLDVSQSTELMEFLSVPDHVRPISCDPLVLTMGCRI